MGSKVCECYLVFFFMFSNFYPLDLQNETCVTIENLKGSMSTNGIENGPHLIQYWLSEVHVC
jgi:hypothetical protein